MEILPMISSKLTSSGRPVSLNAAQLCFCLCFIGFQCTVTSYTVVCCCCHKISGCIMLLGGFSYTSPYASQTPESFCIFLCISWKLMLAFCLWQGFYKYCWLIGWPKGKECKTGELVPHRKIDQIPMFPSDDKSRNNQRRPPVWSGFF